MQGVRCVQRERACAQPCRARDQLPSGLTSSRGQRFALSVWSCQAARTVDFRDEKIDNVACLVVMTFTKVETIALNGAMTIE